MAGTSSAPTAESAQKKREQHDICAHERHEPVAWCLARPRQGRCCRISLRSSPLGGSHRKENNISRPALTPEARRAEGKSNARANWTIKKKKKQSSFGVRSIATLLLCRQLKNVKRNSNSVNCKKLAVMPSDSTKLQPFRGHSFTSLVAGLGGNLYCQKWFLMREGNRSVSKRSCSAPTPKPLSRRHATTSSYCGNNNFFRMRRTWRRLSLDNIGGWVVSAGTGACLVIFEQACKHSRGEDDGGGYKRRGHSQCHNYPAWQRACSDTIKCDVVDGSGATGCTH